MSLVVTLEYLAYQESNDGQLVDVGLFAFGFARRFDVLAGA